MTKVHIRPLWQLLLFAWALCPLIAAAAPGDHVTDWTKLLTLADSLYKAKMPDSAVAYSHWALQLVLSQFGAEDTNTAFAYHRVGLYFRNLDADSSEEYFRRALQIWERNPATNPANYARTLNNLGILVPREGRYEEALDLFARALAIKRRILPRYHRDIAITLYNMSTLYIKLGRYADAEICLQQTAEIWDSVSVSDKPAYYLNCSALYRRQFRYEESIEFAKTAMRLLREEGNLSAYYLSAENAAQAYLDLGRVQEADSIFSEAVTYCDTLSTRPLPLGFREGRVTYRLDLAKTRRLLGRYESAEILLKEAGESWGELSTAELERAEFLDERGRLYYDRKQFEEAAASFVAAIEQGRKVVGTESPRLVDSYLGLCQAQLVLAKPEDAVTAARQAAEISYKNLPLLLATLPENEAFVYAADAEQSVAWYLESLKRLPEASPEETAYAINLIVRTKGITTDLMVQRQNDFAQSADPITGGLREKRRFAAENLSRAILENRPDSGRTDVTANTDSLRKAYRRACSDLALHDASSRMLDEAPALTVEDISRALPNDALALEFYDVCLQDSAGHGYAVAVIGKRGARLQWLLRPDTIDSLVSQYRSHLRRVASQEHLPTSLDRSEYRGIAAALEKEILAPFQKDFRDKSVLYISPAGALGLVAFAGLCDQEGEYLLESFEVHTLDAIRELTSLSQPQPLGHGLLALGDPDFDADLEGAAPMVAQANVYSHPPEFLLRGECATSLDSLIPPLPGTRTEVDELKNSFRFPSEPVEVHYARDATEEIVKSRARGRRFIHLATHGFNLRDNCHGGGRHSEAGSGRSLVPGDPLLSCGIFLAGARQSIVNPGQVNGDDGILYALEVAQLDLAGVELVTLSACESAVGDVRGSDGIYGLRRAFVLAGAQAMLASLWQVPDDATAILMPAIYSRLDRTLPAAVREAQLEFLNSLRKAGRVDHPFLWAAFVPYGR